MTDTNQPPLVGGLQTISVGLLWHSLCRHAPFSTLPSNSEQNACNLATSFRIFTLPFLFSPSFNRAASWSWCRPALSLFLSFRFVVSSRDTAPLPELRGTVAASGNSLELGRLECREYATGMVERLLGMTNSRIFLWSRARNRENSPSRIFLRSRRERGWCPPRDGERLAKISPILSTYWAACFAVDSASHTDFYRYRSSCSFRTGKLLRSRQFLIEFLFVLFS